MTLKSKLLLAQAPLILALVFLGLVAVSTVSRLGEQSQVILADNYRSILAAQRMNDSLQRIDSGALIFLNGRREEGARMAATNRALFESELQVELNNITEPGEDEAAEALRARWQDYVASYDAFLKTNEAMRLHEVYFARLQPKLLKVREQADVILAMNQDAMVNKSVRTQEYSQRMDAFMLAATLAAVLGGLLASAVLVSQALRPLGILSSAVRRFGQGDFVTRAQVEAKDEIGLLAKEFNSMASNLERYSKSSVGELLLAQHTVQAAIDSLPDPILSFDLEGVVTGANQAATEGLGIRLGFSLLDSANDMKQPLHTAVNRARIHVLAGRGKYVPTGFEEAVHSPVGETESYYLPMASPLYGETGSLVGVTVALRDVGVLRRLDDMSSDLVATFAHEFRTPLTSLHMAIHVCREKMAGPLTEKQADILQAAREDCERLQRMIDDLLDIARLQSGRVVLRIRPINLRAFLGQMIEAHRLVAGKSGLTLTGQVWPGCETIQADPDRLELILSNLMANALHHTPAGGSVEVLAKPQDSGVRFEVRDTGNGIPKEYLARIFEKFFRVPGGPSGGSGLGLSIAKNIVEACGGRIGVDSEQGQGSVFWFVIPPLASSGEVAGSDAG